MGTYTGIPSLYQMSYSLKAKCSLVLNIGQAQAVLNYIATAESGKVMDSVLIAKTYNLYIDKFRRF